MNTETTKLWDAFSPSLRPDEVLSLLRLGLEADDDGDGDRASDQEEATRALAPVIPGGSKRLCISDKDSRSRQAFFE